MPSLLEMLAVLRRHTGLPHRILVDEAQYYLHGPEAFDIHGNLIVAAVGANGKAGQIQTFDTSGRLLDAFEPGPHMKYTNLALSPTGTMLITDSEGGNALAFDWPTRGLTLHPFRTSILR